MAWNNVRNEPRREWIEQGLGLVFIVLYVAWGWACGRLSLLIYPLVKCGETYIDGSCKGYYHISYWTDPGNAAIWLGLMVAPWLIVPAWHLTHEIGEFVCTIITSIGFDPRPNPRENTYEYKRARGNL